MLLIKLNHTLLCSGSKVIPEIREQVHRLEARYIAIKQIRDLKDQIKELKQERVWAEVIENEKVKCMYDVKTKQHLLFIQCQQNEMVTFLVLWIMFWNFTYLRHAMVEDHYSVQQTQHVAT